MNNVIGYGSDQDDWYTLNQLRRSISWLQGRDQTKKVNQEALRREKHIYKRFMRHFLRKGRENDEDE